MARQRPREWNGQCGRMEARAEGGELIDEPVEHSSNRA